MQTPMLHRLHKKPNCSQLPYSIDIAEIKAHD